MGQTLRKDRAALMVQNIYNYSYSAINIAKAAKSKGFDISDEWIFTINQNSIDFALNYNRQIIHDSRRKN